MSLDDAERNSHRYYTPEELEHATYPTSDWWEVRDDAVHLKRMPLEGEALPIVERISNPPVLRCGGGWVLAVIGPNGELLSWGHGTE